MSEYMIYTLWQQREERMSHELEHQRVIQERLAEQIQDAQQLEDKCTDLSPVSCAGKPPSRRRHARRSVLANR